MIGKSLVSACFALAVLFAPCALASASSLGAGSVRPDLCGGGYFQSHPVAFIDYLGFFPSQEAASSAALAIDAQRFVVEVREAAVGGIWSLAARYLELPDVREFSMDKAAMSALGKKHGADSLLPGCAGFSGRAET